MSMKITAIKLMKKSLNWKKQENKHWGDFNSSKKGASYTIY